MEGCNGALCRTGRIVEANSDLHCRGRLSLMSISRDEQGRGIAMHLLTVTRRGGSPQTSPKLPELMKWAHQLRAAREPVFAVCDLDQIYSERAITETERLRNVGYPWRCIAADDLKPLLCCVRGASDIAQ